MDLLEFKENKYYDLMSLEKTIFLSEKVRISDPGYHMDTWCAGTLENVLPGEYKCYAQYYSNRISRIEVRHVDHIDIAPVIKSSIDVGVDSGQCGIYDLDYFKTKVTYDRNRWYSDVCNRTFTYVKNTGYVPFKDAYPQYKDFFDKDGRMSDSLPLRKAMEYYMDLLKYNEKACSCETLPVFAADTIDGKALVCSSGYGDGSYVCLYGLWNDKIVSIGIWFIWDEDNWEDQD